MTSTGRCQAPQQRPVCPVGALWATGDLLGSRRGQVRRKAHRDLRQIRTRCV